MVSFLFPTALIAFLLVANFHAFKLNKAENKALQETCGTDMKEVDKYARKVLNGVKARSGEAPWTVAVYIPDHKDDTVYTTGTLISDRHVISYDRLFFTNTSSGISYRHNMHKIDDSICQILDKDLILPRTLTRQVAVYLDMLRADGFSGREQLAVRSVRILNGCITPHHLNRIAIIELMKPIKEDAKARPACVGSEVLPNEPFTFYGFGDNRGEVKDARLRHTEILEVPCENPTEETFCVQAQHPLCNGDFGGAAVKKIAGSVRAFGIYVDGPYECAKANDKTVYTFANMTKLAERICADSGVCAGYLPKPTEQPTATTSLKPESPGPAGYPPDHISTTTQKPPMHGDSEHTYGPGDATTSEYGSAEQGNERTTPSGNRGSDGTGNGGHDGSENGGSDGSGNGGSDGSGNGGHDGAGDGGSVESTNNREPPKCIEDDDGDIHIHIKLGKFRKTGNKHDIEIIRNGPTNADKRAI